VVGCAGARVVPAPGGRAHPRAVGRARRRRHHRRADAARDRAAAALVPAAGRCHPWPADPERDPHDLPVQGRGRLLALEVDRRRIEDVAWSYPEPIPGCPPLAGLVSFDQEKLDTWLVEDDEQVGHPRDPFHRVDARRSSRHVVVRIGGEVVAETRSPVAVFETGLPVRYYVPEADVRREFLQLSETATVCPYKGVASYEHVTVGGRRYDDAAWCYREPFLEALPAVGHRSFDGDGDGVEVQASV
jgi:uncharacterized protein (DUF427 family)